jgi:sialate O-acetylesterase
MAADAKPNSKFGGVQIGANTYSFRDMPDKTLEANLEYILTSGLSSVELQGAPVELYAGIPKEKEAQKAWRASVSMDKFREVKKLFDAAGVKIHILKLQTFGSDEEIDYAFRAAKTVGAKGISTEISLDNAKRLSPFAEKYGLYIIFHNHCQSADPNFSYDPILAISKSIMINFDAGHYFGATGKNPCDFIRQYHSRIFSLHIKDKTAPSEKSPCGDNRIWGQGQTPVVEILQLVQKEKYPIHCDIELEYGVPAGSDQVKEVAKCVQFCKKALTSVKLPGYVSDNMIFQREAPVKLWGWAAKGETVTVSINGQSAKSTADKDGIWRVSLKPLPVGGPYTLLVKGKEDSYTFSNILSGDVWICSGQSNMEMGLNGPLKVKNAEKEVADANYPNIRLLNVAHKMAATPQLDTEMSGWEECSPKSVSSLSVKLAHPFSATGYFFGRELYKNLDIPIGLINTSWGGTLIESWTSQAMMKSVSKYAKQLGEMNDPDFASRIGKDVKGPNQYPSLLYNAMLAPLTAYPVKGVIWYQGESNAVQKSGQLYKKLLPNLITDWREAWQQPDMPFYYVQLANYLAPASHSGGSYYWAELREAQHQTLSLPNTGEAVIIDIGEANDIHPKNKQDVGYRLALNALAKTYGKDVEYSGPEYKSAETKGDKLVLTFTHVGDGLKAKSRYGYVKGFAIAGADKKFYWAKAVIVGTDKVELSCPDVKTPVAARYGWEDNPADVNLYNSANLPASPFRTDDWPL